MAVVMEPWLLGVIAFLWLSAAGLITIGTWKIVTSIKLLKIAKFTHNTYSLEQSVSKLENYREKAINYKEAKELLEYVKNSPEDLDRFKQYVEKMSDTDTKISKLLNN